MNIAIVGTGYVGLVSGTCFAELGANVFCVDVDSSKIEKLKNGEIPIYEPNLDSLVSRNVKAGRLHFTTDLASILNSVEIVFSAVGTPPDEDGSADLRYVLEVARTIGQHINQYLVVVTKSTVPVGTAQKVKSAIQTELNKRNVKIEFDVASNPEFLKEGNAIDDFMKPDRVVVGVESERAKELMTRISFMNDIANLCELVGADVNMVRKGIGTDSRIGSKFLYSGCGYGGSCFPKDVKALIHTAAKFGYDMRVLNSVEEVNEKQKNILSEKFKNYYKGDLKGRKVAVWGLAFKPETDDMREAPALVLIKSLLNEGCFISVYDPVAMEECKRRIGDVVTYSQNMYDAVIEADAIFHVTEWKEFRMPSWGVIKKAMKDDPVLIDGRNVFSAADLEGITYLKIG